MAGAPKKRVPKVVAISARIFDDDLAEIKRRAGTLRWTVWFREFIRESLRRGRGRIL